MPKETVESIVKRFQPNGATLLVDPIVVQEKTASGIIIPEQCRNPLNQGKILSVGDALDPTDWPIDSIVLWTAHSENKLRIDDLSLVVIGIENVVLRERVVKVMK